jgi:hypothetical protein
VNVRDPRDRDPRGGTRVDAKFRAGAVELASRPAARSAAGEQRCGDQSEPRLSAAAGAMAFAGCSAAENVVSRAEFEELMQLVRSQKLASSLATLAALLAAAGPGDAAAGAERMLQMSERVKGGDAEDEGVPNPPGAADDLPRAPAPDSSDATEETRAAVQWPDEKLEHLAQLKRAYKDAKRKADTDPSNEGLAAAYKEAKRRYKTATTGPAPLAPAAADDLPRASAPVSPGAMEETLMQPDEPQPQLGPGSGPEPEPQPQPQPHHEEDSSEAGSSDSEAEQQATKPSKMKFAAVGRKVLVSVKKPDAWAKLDMDALRDEAERAKILRRTRSRDDRAAATKFLLEDAVHMNQARELRAARDDALRSENQI